MLKTPFAKILAICVLLTFCLYLLIRPAAYKRQLTLKDPVRAVQDSMIVLRQICEEVNSESFMNCVVVMQDGDSTLVFNTIPMGPINDVSSTNTSFGNLSRQKVERMLSIMKFLNRNLISGIYHDTFAGVWVYSYGQDFLDRNIEYVRNLYIVEKPQDTLKPSFRYVYHVIDQKGKITLLGMNNFRPPILIKKRRGRMPLQK